MNQVRKVVATPRPAYTLTEMMVSVAASSLLVVGISSSVYFAAQASNPNTTAALTIQSGTTVADIAAEIRSATLFRQRSNRLVSFDVADRNRDGKSETIQYMWSGTPGDPLQRQFNGGNVVDVLPEVHTFDLAFFTQPENRPPRVLFVVPNPSSLSMGDELRRTAMRSWGFQVRLIASTASPAAYEQEFPDVDVAYVTENSLSDDVGTKLTAASIGVVTEEPNLNDELGISSSSLRYTHDEIDIVDNGHPITAGFATARLAICTSTQGLTAATGSLAPDGRVLAERRSSSTDVLVAVDYGGQLFNGETASGRRVVLPWGDVDFDFVTMTLDGLTIMRRAIEWAAGSSRLTRVQIALQTGASPYTRVESEIDMLNQPRVPDG